MKKIIFFCAMLCTVISVKSQCFFYPFFCDEDSLNMRQYEDRYLLNYCCSSQALDLDALVTSKAIFTRDVLDYGTGPWHETDLRYYPYNLLYDFAQPYKVDTPITIAGISGYAFHGGRDSTYGSVFDCYRWYYEIRDSTLTNILRSVDVSDTNYRFMFETPHYTEVLFDEPLTISGKFYVVFHTPDTINTECQVKRFHLGIGGMVLGSKLCSPGTDLHPLISSLKQIDDGEPMEWVYILDHYGNTSYNPNDTVVTALYLFPILADSLSGGDTNVSLSEGVNNLEAVRVFPNPTKNEVNINSGYKMEKIFLYDESGKLLEEKDTKAYNYKIDLQHYPQGSYLLKVQNSKGISTHKV
ncbi:MAG: T9SS type A sorting domain-containing protein, partial [Bacteroidota bacterium]|nr:T9SS type A sorting domain-containing protein [Bacteroidota bacterium]